MGVDKSLFNTVSILENSVNLMEILPLLEL